MTDWTDWHGGECPVPAGTRFQLKFRGGTVSVLTCEVSDPRRWQQRGLGSDITAYRVVEPAPLPASDGLPTERLERIAFAAGMTAEALRPLLRRLHDASLDIVPYERRGAWYILLGRLQELAAEGKGMHADEVRTMAEALPVAPLT